MLAPAIDGASARPPLMLQNKLPRWNEGNHVCKLCGCSKSSTEACVVRVCCSAIGLAWQGPCPHHTDPSQRLTNELTSITGKRPSLLRDTQLACADMACTRAGLRCWCLNFRSRVKLASVKNFQLQCCDADMAEELAAAALPAPGHHPSDPPMTRERRLRQVRRRYAPPLRCDRRSASPT